MAQSRYDFIVVGAGPSGAALATRLAQGLRSSKVLLLEAGADKNDDNPGLLAERWSAFMKYPGQNWGYSTVPQKHCNDREIPLAQGKGLGGGTAINMCVWTLGPKDDYDRMAAEMKDQSFSWENSIRIRQKMEAMQSSVPPQYQEYVQPVADVHGSAGAVTVEWPDVWEDPILSQLEAAKECGLGLNRDINSGVPLGHAAVPATSRRGLRVTASDAYLKHKPANLTIVCNSQVSRILFDGKKAIGVEVGSQIYHCNHEIVISAGAIASPQLLMLSGIGEEQQLSKLGISTIVDLPHVGQELEDHYFAVHSWRAKDHTAWYVSYFNDSDQMAAAEKQFAKDGTGPIAQLFSSISIGFYKMPEAEQFESYASLPAEVKQHLAKPTVPLWESSLMLPPFSRDANPEHAYMTAAVILMSPQSRGSVTLASKDPAAPPHVDPNYFSHPFDLDLALTAERRLVEQILASPRIAKDIYMDQPLNAPASTSTEDILSWWRANGTSTWHPACTVKMGKCVDNDFKVHGVSKLRVVDLSVLPFLPNCHVQSWAYFLGEVAAEKMIKEYA